MRVVCKKNGEDKYYSKLIPEKSYRVVDSNDRYYRIYHCCGHPLCSTDCKSGLFLKEYFYTKEELREKQLDKIGI